jgi:hypothetical protein
VDRALAELHRVLGPDGRAVICDADWDAAVWRSPNPERMGRVLDAFDDHYPHPRLGSRLAPKLRAAGFRVEEVVPTTIAETSLDEDAFVTHLLPAVESFAASHDAIDPGEAEEWVDVVRHLRRYRAVSASEPNATDMVTAAIGIAVLGIGAFAPSAAGIDDVAITAVAAHDEVHLVCTLHLGCVRENTQVAREGPLVAWFEVGASIVALIRAVVVGRHGLVQPIGVVCHHGAFLARHADELHGGRGATHLVPGNRKTDTSCFRFGA